MPRRLLVVITTEVADGALRELVRSRAGDDAEMLVVAPASGISRLDWLTNADDDARADAASLAAETAAATPTENVDASVGDSDPVKAIEDALRRLLRFICEQYVVSLPQLAHMIGRAERTARWLRTRWERAGLIQAGPLVAWEPTLIWASGPGLRLCGYPWKPVAPRLWAFQALTAVELRLALEAQQPDLQWRSRRTLTHERHASDRIPDAVIETGGRGTALYVEQRPWVERDELQRWYEPVFDRYEHLLIVAPPKRVRRIERALETRVATRQATVVAFERNPRQPALPLLPQLNKLDLVEQPERNADEDDRDPWAAAAPTPETGAADDPTEPPEPVHEPDLAPLREPRTNDAEPVMRLRPAEAAAKPTGQRRSRNSRRRRRRPRQAGSAG